MAFASLAPMNTVTSVDVRRTYGASSFRTLRQMSYPPAWQPFIDCMTDCVSGLSTAPGTPRLLSETFRPADWNRRLICWT